MSTEPMTPEQQAHGLVMGYRVSEAHEYNLDDLEFDFATVMHAALAAEREACAQLAEGNPQIAAAIRARTPSDARTPDDIFQDVALRRVLRAALVVATNGAVSHDEYIVSKEAGLELRTAARMLNGVDLEEREL